MWENWEMKDVEMLYTKRYIRFQHIAKGQTLRD
jgi:hypothetical protein